MLGHDHALTGAVAFVAVAPLLHVTGPGLLAGLVLTAGAGVLPDIDEPGSTIARSYGFLTETFAWIVHHLSGGHRKGTHSVLGVLVFTAGAWAAVHFDHTLAGKIALGVFLSLLLSAALAALHVGGHHGDALGVGAAAATIYFHVGLALAPLCIALGAAAHIAGDMLTHGGCPIVYPASREEFHLLPEGLQFTTGKFAEHWIVTPLLTAALLFLAWRDTGLAPLTHYLDNLIR
ncbi:MAG TPA: metal-dependent hydrolase [Streptosporangiaceae bacterium]|jgi:membrane-bound metal-dependent hydrolase YbcI (DUF457 family)